MLNKAKSHLRSNSGDGYIFFLVILICSILIFSAIFNMLTSTVELKTIYNQVENATNVVVSELKVQGYKTLIGGTTEASSLVYDNTQLTNDLNKVLKGAQTGTRIEKNDPETGNLVYALSQIQMTYNNDGIVTITFNIEIPVYLNGEAIYTATEKYSKSTSLSFKS